VYRSLGYHRDILGGILNSTAQARQISAPPATHRQIDNAFGATRKADRKSEWPSPPQTTRLTVDHKAPAFSRARRKRLLYAFNLLAMDGTDLRRERLDDRIWARYSPLPSAAGYSMRLNRCPAASAQQPAMPVVGFSAPGPPDPTRR
jgi:hypothetical protein